MTARYERGGGRSGVVLVECDSCGRVMRVGNGLTVISDARRLLAGEGWFAYKPQTQGSVPHDVCELCVEAAS